MAKGLAVPIAPNTQGRSIILSDDDELQKIISLNLSDLENENPFQQWRGATHGEPGLDPAIIFAENTAALQSWIRRNFKELFNRLEAQGRARLEAGYPRMTTDELNMELEAIALYYNLEINKVVEFSKKYILETQA